MGVSEGTALSHMAAVHHRLAPQWPFPSHSHANHAQVAHSPHRAVKAESSLNELSLISLFNLLLDKLFLIMSHMKAPKNLSLSHTGPQFFSLQMEGAEVPMSFNREFIGVWGQDSPALRECLAPGTLNDSRASRHGTVTYALTFPDTLS